MKNTQKNRRNVLTRSRTSWYSWAMKNVNHIAAVCIAATAPELRRSTFQVLRDGGLWTDQTLDRSFRGMGNRALRRTGEVPNTRCDCVICVEYGGDCSYQMWKEWHGEWHRERRGVKTKGH
jgi:hypothetical protein